MPIRKPHHIADPNEKTITGDDYEFNPRGLNIVWGNDPQYWSIPNNGPASLIKVSWLEVSGSRPVSKGKKYRINFKVSLKSDSFGWNGSQVLVMAKLGKKGTYQYKEVSLNGTEEIIIPLDPLEIEVPRDAPDTDLHFGLYEVWSGKWKGGLEIHNATVKAV